MKQKFLKLLIILGLITSYCWSENNPFQPLMNEVIESDPRNKGIEVSVYYGDNQSILIYNLNSISNKNSMADVFRVFLQFAEKVKSYKFDKVELAFRKKVKFVIDGDYFQNLGKEYSFQNPIYTIRTFPENLMNADGSKAYPKWTGGWIGVSKRQMEDFNDFHKKWYFEELSSELVKTEISDKPDTKVASKKATSKGLVPEEELSSKRHFRKTYWGMSKEQIKKVESSEFIKEEKGGGAFKGLNMLIYKDNIVSLDCFIVYYLAENQLTRGRYLFIEEHSNENLYISDFKDIKNQLTQKYGKPKRDDVIWLNDLYKDDPSDYGMAISVGHLRYLAEWDLPETEIQLVLQGDNYKISCWADYIGKAFKRLEKNAIEKAKKEIW